VLVFYTTNASGQIEKSDTSHVMKYFIQKSYTSLHSKKPKTFGTFISYHIGNQYFRFTNAQIMYGYPPGSTLNIKYGNTQFFSFELNHNKFKLSTIFNWALSIMNYSTNFPTAYLSYNRQQSENYYTMTNYEISLDIYKNIIEKNSFQSKLGTGYYYELFSDYKKELKGLKLLASEQYSIGKRKKIILDLIIEKRYPSSITSMYANGSGGFTSVVNKFKYPVYCFFGLKYKLF